MFLYKLFVGGPRNCWHLAWNGNDKDKVGIVAADALALNGDRASPASMQTQIEPCMSVTSSTGLIQ